MQVGRQQPHYARAVVQGAIIVNDTLRKLDVKVVAGEIIEAKRDFDKHIVRFAFLSGRQMQLCYTHGRCNNVYVAYCVVKMICEHLRPNVEFAEFPVRPSSVPKRKLWPSMAERVDAVDWEKLEKNADREMGEFSLYNSIKLVGDTLEKLGFRDIVIFAYEKTSQIIRVRIAPCGDSNGGGAAIIRDYNSRSIAYVTRRILEAVRGWSLTDAEGGAE